MKLSAVLFLTDILPHRRRLFNKIVKNKIFNNNTHDEVFTNLKKCAIDGIELMLPQFVRYSDADLRETKKVIEKHGLSILSLHQSLRFFSRTKLAEVKEIFRQAKILDSKVIVLHTNTAGKQLFDTVYISAIKQLQKQYGIRVGFENMEKYFGSLHRSHTWHEDKFAELIKINDFFITYDVQHMAHSGGNILQFFKKNKDRIVNVHLSDYRRHIFNTNLRPLRYKHLPLGKGELPLIELIKTLRQEKYTGPVTMEIHTDLTGICESAHFVNSVLGKSS